MSQSFGRKITRAKWPSNELDDICEIDADAISDLRTTSNTLSFWIAKSDDNGLDDLVLTLATTNVNRIDRVQLVWIPESELKESKIAVSMTEGSTFLIDAKSNHRDLISLTYKDLGKVADMICKALKAGRFKTVSKSKVKSLIETAIKEGRITTDTLPEKYKKDLGVLGI